MEYQIRILDGSDSFGTIRYDGAICIVTDYPYDPHNRYRIIVSDRNGLSAGSWVYKKDCEIYPSEKKRESHLPKWI